MKFKQILLLLALITSSTFAGTQEQIITHYQALANEPNAIFFTPPASWSLTLPDPSKPNIKLNAIRESGLSYPAMIYLSSHPYQGSTKDYLKMIDTIERSQGGVRKDLGSIQTEVGSASFSQIDYKSTWGEMRHLLVLIIKDGNAHLLTAAAKKQDFPKIYLEVFESLQTLRQIPQS